MRARIVLCFALASTVLSVHPGSATDVVASWYGASFDGRTMASGEPFDADDPSIAAHRTLPLGTHLAVTNPQNGRSIEVVVRDRGPYVKGRSLDLSRAAAKALGFLARGIAVVDIEKMSTP